ncbi:protein kinase domain-containing protein [Acaryochloris marina NIES-2412]|uniref:protein kinase domain-containing protein n=1 Tax=Acaryochloris marina TaxID=155978 RepID=UPI0040592302
MRPIDGPIPQDVEVFECEDTTGGEGVEAGTHLIIKILLARDRLDPYDAKRVNLLYRESKALKDVTHPGIPNAPKDGFFCLGDTGLANEVYCLVQKKIEGQTLEKWLDDQGPISEKLALDWLNQLAEILHAVHQKGYFHRDIKPANIMIKPDGKLVLIDFGAARDLTDTFLARISSAPLESDYKHELEVTSIFTAGYAPPEQMNGKGLPQSDFYALGRTIVHLLTGVHPNRLPGDIFTGKLTWRDKVPQLSKPFADFLDKLMSIPPGKRPQNTASLLLYLQSSLPKQLKRNRLFNDRRFQIGLGILFLSLLAIGFKLGTQRLSRHYFLLANEQQSQGKLAEARGYYEQAIQLNSTNKSAYNNLGVVCQQLQDVDCVLESYYKGLDVKPKDDVLFYNLGTIHEDVQDYAKARQYYQKSIDASQGQYLAPVNNLARLDLLDNKPQEAEARIQQVLDQSDHDRVMASLYKNLGWARYQQKQYVQAVVSLKKSMQFNPEEVSTHCLLAKAENALGQPSIANWEICMFAKSDLPEIWEWRYQYIQQKENTAKP